MEIAQFHKCYWDAQHNTGIGKIHYQPIGVIAFLFEELVPIQDVNILNLDEVSYIRQEYRDIGISLGIGVQIDRDVSLVPVSRFENGVEFKKLNLVIMQKDGMRYFCDHDKKWVEIESPPIEYQRCDSLIMVR